MKTPKFLSKLSAVLSPRPKKRLQATARAARPAMEDYDSEEPQTKLSSAFIVVLILHVVAVGGIYAFNSIKASRRGQEMAGKTAEVAAPAAVKSAAPVETIAAPAAATGAALTAHKVEPALAHKMDTAALTTAATSPKTSTGRQYEVKGGDNLTKIAFAYKVTPADIMAANQLKEGAVLRPGQSLVIPAARTTAKPAVEAPKGAASNATPATTTLATNAATNAVTATATATPKPVDVPPTKTTPGLYTVKKGDTLTSIARTYGLTLEDLSKANKALDPKKLQLGQVLKVPPRKS